MDLLKKVLQVRDAEDIKWEAVKTYVQVIALVADAKRGIKQETSLIYFIAKARVQVELISGLFNINVPYSENYQVKAGNMQHIITMLASHIYSVTCNSVDEMSIIKAYGALVKIQRIMSITEETDTMAEKIKNKMMQGKGGADNANKASH